MSSVFVIRNQNGHYLSKKDGLWLDGSEPQYLFKTRYQDVALNTLIETNSQQIDIRGEVIEVEMDNRQQPQVDISPIEAKMPSKATPQSADDSETETPTDTDSENTENAASSASQTAVAD